MTAKEDPRLMAFLAAAMEIAATQDLSQDERVGVQTLSIVFVVLAVIFVALRFVARFKQTPRYALDDWLIIASMLLLFGQLVVAIEMTHYGLGLHSGALTLDDATMLAKILLVAEPLYMTNIDLIKLSLLLMYYRIFPIKNMRTGALILGAISIAWNVALVIVAFTQCIPLRKTWQPWIEGRCIDLKAAFLAVSVPNILTDIAILALPMPHVWKLQTDKVQKISLSAIFLLGSFVVFTSIYRFTVYINYDPNDLPYTLANPVAWNVVELSSGIISACLPTLGPLFKSLIIKIGTISSSYKRSATNSHDRQGSNPALITIGGGGHNRNRSAAFQKLDSFGFERGLGSEVTIAGVSGDEIPLTVLGSTWR